MIVIFGASLGAAIFHFIKHYIIGFWWPSYDSKQKELETKLNETQEIVKSQIYEYREALSVIKTFVQGQILDWTERQRLEDLNHEQETTKMSDLKRDIASIRHLLPSIGSIGRTLKTNASDNMMDDIKNELISIKNAIKNWTENSTLSQSQTNLTQSRASLPSWMTKSDSINQSPTNSTLKPIIQSTN